MSKYIIAVVIYILGFWYLLIPLPGALSDFVYPPNVSSNQILPSYSSNLQTSYYSNANAKQILDFYKQQFKSLSCDTLKTINPICYLSPIVISRSPSLASFYLSTKIPSTYLLEIYYPLRNSLFLSIYQYKDRNGNLISSASPLYTSSGLNYSSLVSVYYFPSSVIVREATYIAIWLIIILLSILIKRIIKKR